MSTPYRRNALASPWFWYWLAVAFGGVALAGGVAIFLLWAWTLWGFLKLVGVAWCVVGVGMFAWGITFLTAFWWASRGWEHPRRRLRRWGTTGAGALLFGNFPVAAAIILAALYLEPMCMVRVENHATDSLENLSLSLGTQVIPLGTLPPGGRIKHRFLPRSEGALICRGIVRGQPAECIAMGYVTNSLPGYNGTVVLDASSTLRSLLHY